MKFGLKKSTALIALAAASTGMATAAHATDGIYMRGDLGYSFDSTIEGARGFPPSTLDPRNDDLDDDFMGAVGVGYAFKNGFRLEAEGSYRHNTFPDNSILDTPGGEITAYGLLANLIYDFNHGGSIQPYLGLGVGAANLQFSTIDGNEFNEDSGFAYQGMAGVAFPLSEHFTLDIGYRYFAVKDLTFEERTGSGLVENIDYKHQAGTIGLRYTFGAPEAPPPPPPVEAPPPVQVCPAQEFKVYFEWDKSALNPAALDTINAAAARAKACNVSTVMVKGYTDTSGSAKYNIGLSNRRASVVRDALVSAGLPTSLISTAGLGETELDKATKDGVKEPLNRRTAVTISFQ